jgi:hypothetical protein
MTSTSATTKSASPTGPNGVTWMAMPGAEMTSSTTTATELALCARRKSAMPAAATATSHAMLPIVLKTMRMSLSL